MNSYCAVCNGRGFFGEKSTPCMICARTGIKRYTEDEELDPIMMAWIKETDEKGNG